MPRFLELNTAVLIRLVLIILVALLVSACAQEQAEPAQQARPAASGDAVVSIDAAQEQLTARLISMPGVTGIGTGECDGTPCIRVMLAKKSPALVAEIPSSFLGFPVVVEESGEIRAQD